VGEAEQPEPGADDADQAEGEAAGGRAGSGSDDTVSDDTASDDTASDDTASDDTASDDTASGEARIWDDLPPEVEYPLRPDEVADAVAPGRAEAWRRRTAAGAIFTGFALGLREVLEPDRNEPAIVMETSGVPPKDLPVEADIDQVPPRQSVVKIRPWLLPPAPAIPANKSAGHKSAGRKSGGSRVAADKER
jgi:hypothetical protein